MKPYRGLIYSILLLATVAMFAGRPMPASGAESVEDRYRKARSRCNALLSAHRVAPDRRSWAECIDRIREVARQDAGKKFEDKCNYLLAVSYHRLYELYHNDRDLDSAYRYYNAVTQHNPRTPLAASARERERTLHSESGPVRPPAANTALQPGRDSAPRDEKVPPPAAEKLKAAQPSRLERIAHWSMRGYTRVVLYFSRHISYIEHADEASRPRAKDLRQRSSVDFRDAVPGPDLNPRIELKKEFVKGVRIGRPAPKTIRVMLDTEAIDSHRVFWLEDPYRVVIDIRWKKSRAPAPAEIPSVKPGPEGEAADLDGSPRPSVPNSGPVSALTGPAPASDPGPAAPAGQKIVIGKIPKPEPSRPGSARQAGQRKCIVLDPGHGGKDKGAISVDGIFEKDMVLTIAKELQDILAESTDCEVVLTRTGDKFVSLEQRTAFANAHKADLFVSIHTNAHRDRSLRGVETYFLDLSGDREAARVAALENATSTQKVTDLEAILGDLMLNTKLNESSHLAFDVQRNLISRLQTDYQRIRDLGVKKAPFYVLLGAQMPSILVETAFLTNKEEEDRLKDKTFRRTLVEGIASGIESYMRQSAQDLQAGDPR